MNKFLYSILIAAAGFGTLNAQQKVMKIEYKDGTTEMKNVTDVSKISFVSELFPEPETPVMQVITPNGISTSIFFKLFSLAPLIVRKPVGFLRSFGTGIWILPLRYAPVTESGFCMISSAVPHATTCPPCEPAPGPISTM